MANRTFFMPDRLHGIHRTECSALDRLDREIREDNLKLALDDLTGKWEERRQPHAALSRYTREDAGGVASSGCDRPDIRLESGATARIGASDGKNDVHWKPSCLRSGQKERSLTGC